MSTESGCGILEHPFKQEALSVLDETVDDSKLAVSKLKRIFQKNGVLVPNTTNTGQTVSVHEGVTNSWTWAAARWLLGSAGVPVHLLHARHVPALRQLVSEHAASLHAGPHKSVVGTLGWHVDSKGSALLDSVALVVPTVAQTLEACVYCDGGDLAARRLLIETRVDVMLDLCDALQHLRSAGLVLLDLQASNVALGDYTHDAFTAAVISLKHAYPAGRVLTEGDVQALASVYTAPPVKAGDVVQPGMDCWALGVVLWELVMGFKPVAGVQPGEGQHGGDKAGSRWMLAAEAVTDTVTHDTLTLLLLPEVGQRSAPAEVHQWMQSLKAQVASDMYQDIAAGLADGTELPAPGGLGSSGSLRWEECLAACVAHVGEARNGGLLAEYHADRIGPTLSSLVVATPRACEAMSRTASLPPPRRRWPQWARRAASKVVAALVVLKK